MFTYLLTSPADDFINVINSEIIRQNLNHNTFRNVDFTVSDGEVFASLSFNPNDESTETKNITSNVRVEFLYGTDVESVEGELNVFLRSLESESHLLQIKTFSEAGVYYVLCAYRKG